jgi:hypothetical protein
MSRSEIEICATQRACLAHLGDDVGLWGGKTVNWTRFYEPGALVSFSYPEDWTLLTEGSLQLVSPASSAITWSTFASKVDLGATLKRSEGKDIAGPPGSVGRSWTLSQRATVLMVTYFADPVALEAEREVVEAIIASAELDPPLPADAQALLEEVELRARRLVPDKRVTRAGFGIEVEDLGVLSLSNIYQATLVHPEQRDARIDQALGALSAICHADEILTDFERAGERLFPLLVSAENEPDSTRLVRPLNPSLSIAYSVDFGPAMARVTQQTVSQWGVDAIVVHERALENLAREHPVELRAATRERCSCLLTDEFTFATGQVLLPDYHAKVSAEFGESFIVAMPSRDIVVATRESDIDALSHFAASDYESLPFPLTPEVFRSSPGKLEVLMKKRGLFARLFGN